MDDWSVPPGTTIRAEPSEVPVLEPEEHEVSCRLLAGGRSLTTPWLDSSRAPIGHTLCLMEVMQGTTQFRRRKISKPNHDPQLTVHVQDLQVTMNVQDPQLNLNVQDPQVTRNAQDPQLISQFRLRNSPRMSRIL